jgi:eukaryotic-like serine/threonine-protein kinase
MLIGERYRVDQLVGSGGMGVVVAATHLTLGHRVAIKFLREDVATIPSVVERFMREARAVVQLRTEHVCRVIDVGCTDAGAPFIVMEMLEGRDLGHVVAKQPLPVTIAVEYVLQACVALAEAHAAGIVHRDLKPANLFVTRRPGGGPLIKVLDFGIAKAMTEAGAQLTRTHSMLGTPGYISPEQLQSARDVDARTDIWALGATLYQLLSARLPFYRPNAAEMVVRIMMEPPDPLDIDPSLGAVVLRCLEKDPAQRPADVAALASDLAPFGGPSGRAIAALVRGVLHGAIAPPVATSVVSAHAITAASVVAAPPVGPRATTDDLVPARRRRWGWIAAPIVLAAAGAAALLARRHDAPPAPAVVAEVRAPTPVDAAVAERSPDAAPPDAAPPEAAVPATPRPQRPVDSHAKAPPARTAAKVVRPPAPHPPAAEPRTAAASATERGSAAPKPPATTSVVGDTARELKASCFESAADTPWNSAMCWCTKKDQVHAQAAFAKLTGFKRTTVRRYCALRGITL